MDDIKGLIENEMRLQELQKQRFLRNLQKLPTGRLAQRRGYYYRRDNVEGKARETYILKSNKQLIEQLQTRAYIEKATAVIEANTSAMREFLKKYKNFDPLSIRELLGKTYQMLPEKCYTLCGIHDYDHWDEEVFLSNPFYSENLTMTTIKGEKVRSKSEIDIANQLFLNGIKYRYECQCQVGATTFFPDFAILAPKDYKIYYWEHFGMTNNESYMEKADRKLAEYKAHGIVPWKNLIVTYDDESGNLNSKIISNIIDVFFKS